MSGILNPKIMKTVFQDNEIQIGNYILKEKLGEGQFGKIFKAIHTETKKVFAIKIIEVEKIKRNPKLFKLFKTEISIMHEITHKNIIHLYDFLKSKKHFYLVIDFCNQGDLQKYLIKNPKKYLSEKKAVFFLKQIMNGFLELRKRKILHRDVKLQNIFVNNEQIIIGDFGLSKKGVKITNSVVGTPLTMAYEILVKNSSYNYKADLWSIGVVYYNLLFGFPPFFAFTKKELILDIERKLGNLNFVREDGSTVSKESKELICKLLKRNPEKRINWTDFYCFPLFDIFKTDFNEFDGDFGDFDDIVKSVAIVDKDFVDNKNVFLIRNKSLGCGLKAKSGFDWDLSGGFMDDDQLVGVIEEKKIFLSAENVEDHSEVFLVQKMEEEIGFRFNHEKNKILFIIYTVKKIEKLLINEKYIKIKKFLLNISAFLLKKALVINRFNIIHITAESNIFDLDDYYFCLIKDSKNFKNIKKNFETDDLKIKNFLDLIIDRIYKNNFSFKRNIIDLNHPEIDKINKIVKKNLLCIKFFFSLDDFEDKILKNIFLCIFYSINFEEHFPYFLDNVSRKKFDWQKFKNELEVFKVDELNFLIKNSF